MTIPESTVRLFQKVILIWVAVFTVPAWVGADALNTMLRSPVYLPSGPLTGVTHTLLMLPDTWVGILAPIVAYLLIALCLHGIFRAPRWWTSALIWWAYTNLMNLVWLAGSGGQQLIANLLFWCILLAVRGAASGSLLRASAFWIIRMQLILTYLSTGLHKLQGTHWLDGSALGIVATDPNFGPLWIAGFPLLAKGITWAVLTFQFTFPLAVWWRPTRLPWMLFGIAFHLGTALWMGLADMGLAFIAAYTIWLGPKDLEALRTSIPSKRERSRIVTDR